MAKTVLTLSPQRLTHLSDAYARASAARRNTGLLAAAIILLLVSLSAFQAEINLPTLLQRIGSFGSYIDRIFHLDNGQPVWSDISEWFWGWKRWLRLLVETLLMAYIGTLSGAILGFILAFVSSENLTKSRLLRTAARRFLEFCRTVPDLVYALIYVVAFGLGAIPGVLAIASHTVGALGKQFADSIENIDMKPVEGAVASGASWAEIVRFAAVPQVLPLLVSYTMLRFEINVRSAGVIGLVGAGGIGRDIMVSIRSFQYSDISALLVMIVVTVMIVDILTGYLRHRFMRAHSQG